MMGGHRGSGTTEKMLRASETRDTSHYSPLATHLSLLEAKPKDARKIYYPISVGVTLLRERLRFGSTGTTRSTPSRPG